MQNLGFPEGVPFEKVTQGVDMVLRRRRGSRKSSGVHGQEESGMPVGCPVCSVLCREEPCLGSYRETWGPGGDSLWPPGSLDDEAPGQPTAACCTILPIGLLDLHGLNRLEKHFQGWGLLGRTLRV